MLKRTLLAAALIGGAVGLAGPVLAQTVTQDIVVSRVIQPDGILVETHRIAQSDGTVIETKRFFRREAALSPRHEGSGVSGGVGGAIGGYYILGTTPADNKPLPPEWMELPEREALLAVPADRYAYVEPDIEE